MQDAVFVTIFSTGGKFQTLWSYTLLQSQLFLFLTVLALAGGR